MESLHAAVEESFQRTQRCDDVSMTTTFKTRKSSESVLVTETNTERHTEEVRPIKMEKQLMDNTPTMACGGCEVVEEREEEERGGGERSRRCECSYNWFGSKHDLNFLNLSESFRSISSAAISLVHSSNQPRLSIGTQPFGPEQRVESLITFITYHSEVNRELLDVFRAWVKMKRAFLKVLGDLADAVLDQSQREGLGALRDLEGWSLEQTQTLLQEMKEHAERDARLRRDYSLFLWEDEEEGRLQEEVQVEEVQEEEEQEEEEQQEVEEEQEEQERLILSPDPPE